MAAVVLAGRVLRPLGRAVAGPLRTVGRVLAACGSTIAAAGRLASRRVRTSGRVLLAWGRRAGAVLAVPIRWVARKVVRVLAILRSGLRPARATLIGGWRDIRSVVARVSAPARESAARARTAIRSTRQRVRAQAAGLRAALRLRR